jgi:Peptidase A4 family
MADTQDGPRVHKLPSGFNVTTFPLPPRGMRLTDASPAERARYGIPPLPDRDKHPALHAFWLKDFDRKLQFIVPEFKVIPNIRHLPRQPSVIGGSGNWSGAVVAAPSGGVIGGAVGGHWNVPVLKNVDGNVDYCLIWVGIDGDPTISPNLANNLVQAGTQLSVDATGNLFWYAWWNWLAQGLGIQQANVGIMNMPVQFGADFATSIWLTSPTTANVYMVTTVTGATESIALITSISAPPTVALIGGCAEWIVERPTDLNGKLYPLANYGSVEFGAATAATTALQGSVLAGQGSPIVMTDPTTGKILSTGKIVSGETVVCTYG